MSTPFIMSTPDVEAFLQEHQDERQPCEIWTRVMGYYRPVSAFNTGKLGEFNERQFFKLNPNVESYMLAQHLEAAYDENHREEQESDCSGDCADFGYSEEFCASCN